MTPAGTSTNLTSRINGMTTHTHAHTYTKPEAKVHDEPLDIILVHVLSNEVKLDEEGHKV